MARGRGVPAGLSRQLLRRAVLDVADHEGLEAVTVRSVARHLGVEAMSIYHYFPSKDALMAAAWDEVVCRLDPAALQDTPGWVDYALGFADQLRVRLLEHPNALPIMLGRHVNSEDSMTVVDQIVGALHQRGLPLPQAIDVLDLVSMFTMAYALNEHLLPTRHVPTPDPERHPALTGATNSPQRHWKSREQRFHEQVEALLSTCA